MLHVTLGPYWEPLQTISLSKCSQTARVFLLLFVTQTTQFHFRMTSKLSSGASLDLNCPSWSTGTPGPHGQSPWIRDL